jgi:hypothetical protein
MMRLELGRQRDLFEQDREVVEVPVAARSGILRLIEDLLAEAIAGDQAEAPFEDQEKREAGHEQDHA